MGSQTPVRLASVSDSGHAVRQAGQVSVISIPALLQMKDLPWRGQRAQGCREKKRQTGPRLLLLAHGSVQFPPGYPRKPGFLEPGGMVAGCYTLSGKRPGTTKEEGLQEPGVL